MDFIDGVHAYLATARSGSFTKASEQLGISNKLVSKYVAELEHRLGVRLFHRTTRALSLTSAGQSYLTKAHSLVAAYNDFHATGHQTLRITAPFAFGESLVLPAITAFQDAHPGLKINLNISDDRLDLAKEALDFAIRIGQNENTTLKARKLGQARLVTAASPEYLKSAPPLKHPDDIIHHQSIIDTNSHARRWPYMIDGQIRNFPLQSQIAVNGVRATTSLALAHRGLIMAPDIMLQDHLANASLIECLPDFSVDWLPIHVLYLPSPVKDPLRKAFLDFLTHRFREDFAS